MIDITAPPPKRWIEATLTNPVNMTELKDVFQIIWCQGDELTVIAHEIRADHPDARATHADHRLTHRLWALVCLEDYTAALAEAKGLLRQADALLRRELLLSIPAETLLMLVFVGLRAGDLRTCRIGLVLLRRLKLTPRQTDDFIDLFQHVQAMEGYLQAS